MDFYYNYYINDIVCAMILDDEPVTHCCPATIIEALVGIPYAEQVSTPRSISLRCCDIHPRRWTLFNALHIIP